MPRALVDSTENFGEETFLVFVHVAVGTICYVIGFSTWALLVNLGLGLWEASVSFVVVTAFAWVAFDAWPVLRGYGTPSGWWSASLGSFALYALAFLGGSVGLVHVLFG